MHNKRHLIKRIIEMTDKIVPDNNPLIQPGKTRTKIVKMPKYVFGIFTATSHGGRQLTMIVDGSYQDAVKMLKSERTERGHSFKGFKKLKQDVE